MTPDQQRIAIAEACGWKRYEPNPESISRGYPKWGYWIKPVFSFREPLEYPPDYLNDLNAMHVAEKVLTDETWPIYLSLLTKKDQKTLTQTWMPVAHASASTRAEAFLRTLNLYTPCAT